MARVILIAMLVPAVGCGTVQNMKKSENCKHGSYDKPQPVLFGGVRSDVQAVGGCVHQLVYPPEHRFMYPIGQIGAGTVLTLDMPFSLVGDVVTAPVVIIQNLSRALDKLIVVEPRPLLTESPSGTSAASADE